MHRHSLILTLLAASLLAGCGTGASAPTPTPVKAVPTARYSDRHLGFSFKYPETWSVPQNGGHNESNGGINQYVLDITIPGNDAQVSVTVDANVQPFPPFVNGHRSHLTNDPHTYVYFHRTVAQWPAMRVERFNGSQMNEIDTFVNTRTKSYDIRTLAANPPFSASTLAGYETVVRSFTPPFS